MDADAKKTVLRMIHYGIYVLGAKDGAGGIAAATVNWVTQAAFDPPLVAVGVKVDSNTYRAIVATRVFSLNMLGKEHKDLAFTFFKPTVVEEGKLNGQPYHAGENGAPIIDAAVGALECNVVEIVERGDHHLVVGEVTNAAVLHAASGRPDAATLQLRELGENIFYGG